MSSADPDIASGLDWPGLMRAGISHAGLEPDVFWQLTPAELALVVGVTQPEGGLKFDRFASLMAAHPDTKRTE